MMERVALSAGRCGSECVEYSDEAFSLSKQMTTGQKMNLFVLDLSFLGWYFLGFLCFGIGALFVQPYDIAAFTEVYLILKESVKKDEYATDIQSD